MEITLNIRSCWMMSVDFCVWCKGRGGRRGGARRLKCASASRALKWHLWKCTVNVQSKNFISDDMPHTKTRVNLIYRNFELRSILVIYSFEGSEEKSSQFSRCLDANGCVCKMSSTVNVPWWKWYTRLIMERLSTSFSKKLLFSPEDPSL